MTYKLSKHAIDRFRQRGRPLSFKRAKSDLEQMLPAAEWHDRAPDWLLPLKDYDGVLLMGDLAFIVQNNVIVTCVSKGGIPPKEREKRRQVKKERRQALARRRGL